MKPFKPSTGGAGGPAGSSGEEPGESQRPGEANPGGGWIEIMLFDEEKKPVAGQLYRITLPDGSVQEGTLDEEGLARVEGFESGMCQVTFPDLDQDAWEPA